MLENQWHGSVHNTQVLGYRRLVWCAGFKRLSQAYYYGNGMLDRTEPDLP